MSFVLVISIACICDLNRWYMTVISVRLAIFINRVVASSFPRPFALTIYLMVSYSPMNGSNGQWRRLLVFRNSYQNVPILICISHRLFGMLRQPYPKMILIHLFVHFKLNVILRTRKSTYFKKHCWRQCVRHTSPNLFTLNGSVVNMAGFVWIWI